MPYLKLLRPQQWVKNVFVFAGLVFGKKLTGPHALHDVLLTVLGFACLCLASSAVYVLNDLHDREEDRLHPRKKNRPIASGQVAVPSAIGLALGLMAASLAGGFVLDLGFGVVVGVYLILQLAYTFSLKHQVILDVIAIGLGFVLRAIAGAVLVHVEISQWLVICTFTLCLFLGFSKRRSELTALAGANGDIAGAAAHRKTLRIYTPDLLNHMTTLTAAIAVVTFLLYANDARTVNFFGTNYLVYTLPFVVYAIFRFAVLVEHGEVDGPTDVVVKDLPFQLAVAAWIVAALFVIYWGRPLHDYLTRAGPG